MDLNYVAQVFGKSNPLRFRVGTVISVQTDRTCTVTIGGDTTQIAGVRYMSDIAPDPNAAVWLVTDGRDMFVLGHMAAVNRTLATKASRSTAQSVANATDAAIDFDSATYNDWGAWASGANAARITAPVSGRYMVIGNAAFNANGTGFRRLGIEQNGSNTIAQIHSHSNAAGTATSLSVSAVTTLAVGDYVRLIARQNSGGALDVNSGADLSLVYLGS